MTQASTVRTAVRTTSGLLTAALLGTTPVSAGTVLLEFEQPERYTDVGPRRDADRVQQALREMLQTLGAQRLPADQTLNIAITDIDLAGEIPPATPRLHDVRVMGRHPDWPRITLRYRLQAGSRVLAEGSEVVSDMAYLLRSHHAIGSEPLPYERRMLSDWFTARFVQPAGN